MTTATEEVTVNLAGKTTAQIAEMISAGEITQEFAEAFVSSRAVGKLHKALGS